MPLSSDDFARQLQSHRPMLLKFALRQLRHPDWAEDAVSDTLLAALAKPTAFAERAQLRTWLVGILKHKVLDQMRQNAKEACHISTDADDQADPLDELVADAQGHFTQMPAQWGNPEQDLSQRQFVEILELCTDKLPAAQGRAFMMREWLELSVEEICKELDVSATNLYVLLHRARLRLRECLELHWFGREPRPSVS
jgi:RNA polymerase sigma-70 factor (ECF subfamily)